MAKKFTFDFESLFQFILALLPLILTAFFKEEPDAKSK